MAKDTPKSTKRKGPKISDEYLAGVDELFSTLDETGHTNPEAAQKQHARRRAKGVSVEIDPLDPDADPSGSDVERHINRTAMLFVIVFLAIVLILQVSCSIVRRTSSDGLAETTNVRTVTNAMKLGVEWGDGFTQFPEEFSVQEASEDTGRVEVTVTNTSSADALQCFSSSQIQATALSTTALMNPNIDTVVYHVNVHVDDNGNYQRTWLFGLIRPQGEVRSFMTFVWTKKPVEGGVQLSCVIIGVDEEMAEQLRDQMHVTVLFPTSVDDSLEDETSEDGVAELLAGLAGGEE